MIKSIFVRSTIFVLAAVGWAQVAPAADATRITPQKDIIGFTIGDDYHMANYTQISALLLKWQTESDRLKVVSIGHTEEGRTQYMAILTSPANHAKLARFKEISYKLARAEMPEADARALAREGKAVVWIDGGLHATETVNSQSLAEMVYQMVSRTDEETLRFLDDVVLLMPVPNPDGVELVANWYMREPDETKRTFNTLPRLYHKYIGHDNNRDSITMNMSETINQNHVLFVEWDPVIMHNVHQTGPAGSVIFIPPFRDPFNYDVDPMIPISIELLGTHMQARLVGQGMGGSATRSAAPYSTWWNGGMRTATYFRNEIGLLTEIIGGPTPSAIPFIADKQLPRGDWPLPIAPQIWHYRQSIDYMIQVERAVVDYASRNREPLLFQRYAMGRRSIDRGSRDNWTITPKRIAAVTEAAKAMQGPEPVRPRGALPPGGGGDAVVGGGFFGPPPLPAALYEKILHDPAYRDARGYIITKDQDDYPTMIKFVNVLLKGGIDVQKATAPFQVNGKSYPAGSFVVMAAQAFRPAVLDSFEPQDHPMDFAYPGGPPLRPYDITGWTLAVQMGIKFDRVLDGFTGPFQRVGFDMQKPDPAAIAGGGGTPVGYILSHEVNDSFIVMNRLLKAGASVYWLKDAMTVEGKDIGTGAMYVPATPQALPILQKGAQELGVPVFAVTQKPTGDALKLKPIRIGLVDVYGGSMPSGWLRWMMEQYEFPFEVVFPQVLDAGNLKSNFDVVVFASGTYAEGRGGRPVGGALGRGGVSPDEIPEEFRSMLGAVTASKSVPALKTFVEEGGTVLAIGSSATIGQAMGLPVTDHLVETDATGNKHHLSSDKFYVPGSVLHVQFNNQNPLAYGMPKQGFVFFDDSPTFDRVPGAKVAAERVAWFQGKSVLYSGWAVGQEYLDGAELATEASIGKGKLVLISFEATFRATPHQNFKLFFNGLYFGSGTSTHVE